uniref:PXA domain-containing protein n=1 Tax=Pan troglodytes TaxID=9598 RepID=A0A2I3TK21_PANTR
MKTETVPSFQEIPAGSSCHLNNLLSRRKVMAVGVFVWLLCLLSALLVVLGGWLGSSVSGVASSPLLLEGFIPLATCPLFPETERQLEQEINYFILSWYCSESQEPAFEEEMEAAMKELVQELQRRMSMMDHHALAQSSYIQAKEATTGKNGPVEPSHLWEAYCRATAPHPAVHSPNAEVTYTCGIVNLLLQGLVPKSHLETHTGCHVVVELIICSVVLPLISRLSDADWIHLVLMGIFSKARDPTPCPASGPEQPSVPTSLPLIAEVQQLPEGRAPSPVAAPGEPEIPAGPSSEVEGGHEAVEGDLETIMLMTLGHFLSDRIQDALCALEGSQALEPKGGEGSEGVEAEGPGTETETVLPVSTLNFCPEIQIDIADKEIEQGEVTTSVTALLEGLEKTCSSRPSCLEKDLTNDVTYLDPSLPPVLLSSSSPGPLSSATFSFEPLSSPDGPVVIQNLHITGTITAREHSGTGLHPCTRYTVKCATSLDGENSSLQQLAYHTVNHRYWEFLNLQIFHLENIDSDRVERLCAIPEIANSEEVQEFLAVNTDAHVSFVKKPFMVSRIEKMVVSAIVDNLKTAFPCSESQGPTEELSEAETESRSQTEGKKASKSRLRFSSSKISPALSVTEAQDKILYCLQEGNVESKTLSMSGMESFIEKQTKLLEMQPTEAPEKDPEQLPKGHVDSCLSDAAVPAQDPSNSDSGTETELADTALNLLLLLLTEQWKWLCTENMQKFLRLIFGTLVQRWLEGQVANLTSPQCWVQYLWLLQESIWPGGVLPKFPRPVRTQYRNSWGEQMPAECLVLESLQQPLINRHLIYCLGDIILEFLDLSASVEESAATTSA